MEVKSEATFLFLKVSGDEAVKSASEVLSKLVAGMVPATPNDPAPADTSSPAAEPLTVIAGDTYEKPDDEPDGFVDPEPPRPRKSSGRRITRSGGSNYYPVPKKPKAKSDKPPGVLAMRIMKLLDNGNGVAPLDHLVSELGVSAQACNMAITKCGQLQRLDDGRIAMTGYRDED